MICVDQPQNIKLVVLEVILPLIYCKQVGILYWKNFFKKISIFEKIDI